MTEHFEAAVEHMTFTDSLKSVSFDGAAFDANQHHCIQEVADASLWHIFKPYIEKHLASWANKDHIMKGLERFWLCFETTWFISAPELRGAAEMTRADRSLYNKCWSDKKGDETIALHLKGSTFSGHPTLTTLGNTFRSLSYMWWYLEKAGLKEAWKKNQDVAVFAAGDDSVMLIENKWIEKVYSVVKLKTAKDKKTPNIGLGQCIEDHKIMVDTWRHFDFCSKWCMFDGKTWAVTRDYSKVVWNKQDYSGHNTYMQEDKTRHTGAILAGLEAEGVKGSALHMLVEQRHLMRGGSTKQQDLQKNRSVWLKEHSWDWHYTHEQLPQSILDIIDEKLGLNKWWVSSIVQARSISIPEM